MVGQDFVDSIDHCSRLNTLSGYIEWQIFRINHSLNKSVIRGEQILRILFNQYLYRGQGNNSSECAIKELFFKISQGFIQHIKSSIYLTFRDDERRRNQKVISSYTINYTSGWINHTSFLHS